MQLINGRVVLELKDCTSCKYGGHPGEQAKTKWRACEKCKGTGRRGNGRCRNCNPSGYQFGDINAGQVKYYDHDDLEPCSTCHGKYRNFKPEGITDNCPPSFFNGIPMEVVGSGTRGMSGAEQMFGMGVYTVIDYGRHKAETDDQLIERMRTELESGKTTVQACKVVKSNDDLTFCSGFAILRADRGFSVVPHWN